MTDDLAPEFGPPGAESLTPYTALYLLSCVGVKGDLVVAGDDELTRERTKWMHDGLIEGSTRGAKSRRGEMHVRVHPEKKQKN